MILKDLSRKIYKRICYSLEQKRILYIGISPKGRDEEIINWLDKHNNLTLVDKELINIDLKGKKFFVQDITQANSFEDNYFDAIIMLGVVGYGLDIVDTWSAFRQMRRILKDKGKLYFELTKEKDL